MKRKARWAKYQLSKVSVTGSDLKSGFPSSLLFLKSTQLKKSLTSAEQLASQISLQTNQTITGGVNGPNNVGRSAQKSHVLIWDRIANVKTR